MNTRKVLEALAARAVNSFVLAVITESKGSVPASAGRIMAVTPDDIVGSIGGGAIEKKTIDEARDMLRSGAVSRMITADLLGKKGSDGICGGYAKVFLFRNITKASVLLFGAGHINQALKGLLEGLSYDVRMFDKRITLQQDNYIAVKKYDDIKKGLPGNAYAVIATHSHEEDEKALFWALKNLRTPRYIAVVSSARKFKVMRENIVKKGIKVPSCVYAPAGLDISGNEPAEVALSIASQIEKRYFGKDGRDLREKKK